MMNDLNRDCVYVHGDEEQLFTDHCNLTGNIICISINLGKTDGNTRYFQIKGIRKRQ